MAEINRPIVLEAASGEWISSREAKSLVERLCQVDDSDAIRAICRRAVMVVPVMVATWSRSEDPHDYIDRMDYFSEQEPDNTHFSRTINRRAFTEICDFFVVLEQHKDIGVGQIHHENWATGDFEVTIECDFSDVKLTIVGLQFDRVALMRSFTGGAITSALDHTENPRKGAGRPASPAWPQWIAELVSYIHENGFPAGEGSQGQESVISAVADRLAERGLECPSRATVQTAVSAVLDRLRSSPA
ncbi:MAG: hypothetical protein ABL914_09110 [Novosphingobium sp.]|uniref:hypothetical protein n=1 Tax=Novosphingobium sp. TaxID=1874826 RepID=UPI0032B9E3F4